MSNYIIGSGWWCDGTGRHVTGNHKSTDKIRMVGFFDLWYDKVQRFSNHSKIVIVDSKSPVKPDFSKYSDITTIDLLDNFNSKSVMNVSNKRFKKNAEVSVQRTAGTRQVFMSAWYALYNDIKYYVWIEQDCLIHGDVVEAAIDNMEKEKADYSMGTWNHRLKLETSFMVFRTKALPAIWDAYKNASSKKPELRYHEMQHTVKFCKVPFGYGRNRPINFDDEMFFAQQITEKELEAFKNK